MAKRKQKTHQATKKRMKVTGSGKVTHWGQGGGNGHSNNYKNRRQKKSARSFRKLRAKKEHKKVLRLLGKSK